MDSLSPVLWTDAKLMIDTRGRVHNLYAQPTLYQDIARHMRAYLEQEGQDISDLHVEELWNRLIF